MCKLPIVSELCKLHIMSQIVQITCYVRKLANYTSSPKFRKLISLKISKLPICPKITYYVPKCASCLSCPKMYTNYLSCPIIFKLPIMSQKEDIISLYITPGPTKIVTNHSKYNQIKPTQNLNSTSQPIFIISPKFQ